MHAIVGAGVGLSARRFRWMAVVSFCAISATKQQHSIPSALLDAPKIPEDRFVSLGDWCDIKLRKAREATVPSNESALHITDDVTAMGAVHSGDVFVLNPNVAVPPGQTQSGGETCQKQKWRLATSKRLREHDAEKNSSRLNVVPTNH